MQSLIDAAAAAAKEKKGVAGGWSVCLCVCGRGVIRSITPKYTIYTSKRLVVAVQTVSCGSVCGN